MLETTRIRREGFPFRLAFPEFCAQYSGIAFPFSQRVAGTKEKCAEIMVAATKQLNMLNAGNSKVRIFLCPSLSNFSPFIDAFVGQMAVWPQQDFSQVLAPGPSGQTSFSVHSLLSCFKQKINNNFLPPLVTRYSEKAGCLQRAWRRIQARRLLQKLRDAAARNRNAANYFFEEMGLGIQAVGRILEVLWSLVKH